MTRRTLLEELADLPDPRINRTRKHQLDEILSTEPRHGRIEDRYVTVIADPPGLLVDWRDLTAVVQVNRECEVNSVNASTTHYYFTSRRGTAAGVRHICWWGICRFP